MFFKYAVTIFFRNGKTLELLGNNCSTFKDPNGFSMILSLDSDRIIELPEGIGNPLNQDEVVHYNAFPRPSLYNYFPKDWDEVNGRFNLIDRVVINSAGREAIGKPPRRNQPVAPPAGTTPGSC